MPVYEDHYTRLRAACFGSMLHGIGWDKDNASRLADRFSKRRVEIKEEILKLTDGFPLWSIKYHRSEEMKDALDTQKRLRAALKERRKLLSGTGAKAKDIRAQLGDQIEGVRIAEQRVRDLRGTGGATTAEIGDGLSDDAIGKYFYEKLGLPKIYKLRKEKKVKTVTVDDIALKKIRQSYPELKDLVGLIREHRKCTKLVSTYLDPAKLDADGRLRCMYKTYGTNSGRLASSSNPEGRGMNLQNMDGSLKPLMIPDEGE